MTNKIPITIATVAEYLPDQSIAENNRFLWSYDITIVNESDQMVQLLNRYWRITDMTGHIEEVRGPGVIGLQPVIKPGKTFAYTSFCQLITSSGTMEGHYEMQAINDEEMRFVIEIPKFVLASPIVNGGHRGRLH